MYEDSNNNTTLLLCSKNPCDSWRLVVHACNALFVFLSPVASSFSQAQIVFSVPGQFKVTPTSHHNFIMTENFICMIEVCGKYAFGSKTRAGFLLSKMAQININLYIYIVSGSFLIK